jgi:hypothetical protein
MRDEPKIAESLFDQLSKPPTQNECAFIDPVETWSNHPWQPKT